MIASYMIFWGSELTLLFFFYTVPLDHIRLLIVDGKEVVNFASANYLGLIGNEKIIVRDNSIAWQYFNVCIFWNI